MKRLFPVSMVVAALFAGCSVGPGPLATGGGDDFPNAMTAATLGKRLAGNLNQYQNWDSSLAVNQTAPIPSATVPGGIAKMRAGAIIADSFTLDSTAAFKRITIVHDSIVADTVSRGELIVDAGPDKNFNTAQDNKILYSDLLVRAGVDTLEHLSLTDADHDSAVIDFGLRDSNVINLNYRSTRIALRPDLASRSAQARFVIFQLQSAKNYPVKYWAQDTYKNGFSIVTAIVGSGADSCFYPGDTAWGSVVFLGAPADSNIADTLRYTALLGPNPHDSADDSLLGVYAHALKRSGHERDVSFSFTSDSPVGKNRSPVAGRLAFALTDENAAWIMVNGTFNAQQIAVTYTDSKNNKLALVWDRGGNLISRSAVQ
ncbi:MAG: hypothetical protein PHC61_12995 [Chitinivibrionales bacterium]|nr:hypothetical protein [Chitinivibrionales bacterium]